MKIIGKAINGNLLVEMTQDEYLAIVPAKQWQERTLDEWRERIVAFLMYLGVSAQYARVILRAVVRSSEDERLLIFGNDLSEPPNSMKPRQLMGFFTGDLRQSLDCFGPAIGQFKLRLPPDAHVRVRQERCQLAQ